MCYSENPVRALDTALQRTAVAAGCHRIIATKCSCMAGYVGGCDSSHVILIDYILRHTTPPAST